MHASADSRLSQYLFKTLSLFGMMLFGYEKGRIVRRNLRRYFRPAPVRQTPGNVPKPAADQATYRPVFNKPVSNSFFRPFPVS
ncbi:hypothetical protein GCM10027299_36620 [Larkinella ripae]